jgi:hypothetical protein
MCRVRALGPPAAGNPLTLSDRLSQSSILEEGVPGRPTLPTR